MQAPAAAMLCDLGHAVADRRLSAGFLRSLSFVPRIQGLLSRKTNTAHRCFKSPEFYSKRDHVVCASRLQVGSIDRKVPAVQLPIGASFRTTGSCLQRLPGHGRFPG